MAYIKEGDKIYEVTTRKVLVDLDTLKATLADEKAMVEPSNEELIEHGKIYHPYYSLGESDLEKKIAEIEKGIKA